MPTSESGGTPPSLSDAISRLMENPEIISTVASALGNISAAKTAPAEEPAKEGAATAASTSAEPMPEGDLSSLVSSLAPIMSGISGLGGNRSTQHSDLHASDLQKREELLCALKPYVSEGRRDAIDYIIRISRVSELLKSYNKKETIGR